MMLQRDNCAMGRCKPGIAALRSAPLPTSKDVLHLSCSCVSPFGPAIRVTQPERSSFIHVGRFRYLLPLSKAGIFAVVRREKLRWGSLDAPNFVPCFSRMLPKICIPLFKVSIDCRSCVLHRRIIAVLYDGTRHAAKD